LVEAKRQAYPFLIVAIHTARHGTAYNPHGLPLQPSFGAPAASVNEFLDKSGAEIVVELTTLNPATGEPAIAHIRSAFVRSMHVVTANKGPIAHAYRALCDEASRIGVQFRFESTVMDGAPVFNMVRNNLPGVQVTGFAGALNSTSKLVIAAMRRGLTFEDGVREAQRLGVAEADASFDTDGWDSAAKGAAIANVLMDGGVTPLDVDRKGIGKLTPERLHELASKRKTVVLVTRGKRTAAGVKVRVRAEVLEDSDVLATVQGTSNIILFQTDLMGTIGTVSIEPQVEQTAYGVFSDLVDIAKSL
jgi:homoserine dehydrogenase